MRHETEIESFLPHKLSDEVKGKLRVAGRGFTEDLQMILVF